MHMSEYEIVKKVTPYQYKLLQLLANNHVLVTNEGDNFRVWLEYNGKEVKPFPIRKDSAEKLLTLGAIELDNNYKGWKYHYKLSVKGISVLQKVSKRR